jgi:hypothetical protein
MRTTVTEHAGLLLPLIEEDEFVFEVNFETSEPTDVILRFRRDGERVGSIYDDETEKTIARLRTAREGADFIGVPVPKEFVSGVPTAAVETGRHRRVGRRGLPVRVL